MIEQVTLSNAAALDEFVLAHPNGHFMQTSLWGRVKTDRPWHGLILRGADGQIRGTVALLEHKMHLVGTRFFYAPRGPVWTRGDDQTFRDLIDAAKTYAKKHGGCFLRIDPEVPEEDVAFADLARSMGFSIDASIRGRFSD